MNESPEEAKAREQAMARLIERLRAQKPVNIGPWTREELYERDDAEQSKRRHRHAGKRGEAP